MEGASMPRNEALFEYEVTMSATVESFAYHPDEHPPAYFVAQESAETHGQYCPNAASYTAPTDMTCEIHEGHPMESQ